MRWLLTLAAGLLLFITPMAVAQTEPAARPAVGQGTAPTPIPGTTGVTSFGAKKADRPAPASGDYRAMLGVCDEQREACEKDAVGVPFLAAAYMALWAILIAFLFMVRAGNARTRAEMEELRTRLRALEKPA